MKKLYYLIVLVLILGLVLAGCTFLSNIGQAPATEQSGVTYLTKGTLDPDDLVGLWHLDGNALDSSLYDNGGMLNNFEPPYGWVSGMFGQALSFDGVDDYVDVPDSTSLDITGAITIECWVKREQAAYQTLISKWSAADNQRSYLLALTAGNNVRFWITSGGTWGTLKELTSSGTVGTDWTHIAATYDGNDKMTIYIDNAEDLSHVTTDVPIFAGDAPLMFGVHPAYMTDGWVPGYFKGILDEVRIWKTALLLEQLGQVYDFEGFFHPVVNPPTKNMVKAGRAIPVKFSLNGDQGLEEIFAAGYPNSYKIDCDTTASLNELEETATAGGSSLNYDTATDQYIYVWKTDKKWAGTCRRLEVKLDDGTSRVANFKFK